MSMQFRSVIKTIFPKACIVADRFHMIRLVQALKIKHKKNRFYNLFWGAKVTVQMRVLSAPTFFSIKK